MEVLSAITTFLFTDIEGSSQLWERDPERMRLALTRHDAIAREAVEVATALDRIGHPDRFPGDLTQLCDRSHAVRRG